MDMRERAEELKSNGMQCNCDLDNWVPEPNTGHSWVCRIHKSVLGGIRPGFVRGEFINSGGGKVRPA
jgi:hypothetical protein